MNLLDLYLRKERFVVYHTKTLKSTTGLSYDSHTNMFNINSKNTSQN